MNDDIAPILKGVKPSGFIGAAVQYVAAAFLSVGQAVKLAYLFLKSPSGFCARKDRSALDTKDPPGLQGLVHEYLHVNGIRIHAVSLGRQPHKPLMLFLHGCPEFWYSWRKQLRHYSLHYDAVAIDMRGYGQSDKPAGVASYALDVLASDVREVVRALGHERCVLVAHDWGGIVAWLVAGMYPEIVDRLVTLAGPHLTLFQRNITPRQALKSWYMLLFQAPFIPELAMSCYDYAEIAKTLTPGTTFGPLSPSAFTDEDKEYYKLAFSRPGAATAVVNYYRAMLRCLSYAPIPRVWAALRARLRMPVLAVMADRDGALEPGLMRDLEQVAVNSEFHVMQKSSHWIQAEQPDKVNQLVDDFLLRYPPTV